jgi:uncharacterized HAD superfamily protein
MGGKKKICIDLDDTIWELHKPFFEFYSEKTGKKVSYKEYNVYSLIKFFGISEKEEFDLYREYEKTKHFFNPVFLDGFLEALGFLKENYEIHFVTARHEGIKEKTEKILRDNFDFEFNVFFTRDLNRGEIKSKEEYCLENGINLIIEDKLETVEKCVSLGIKAILINYPWNQKEEEDSRIKRVDNWKEILEILKNEN